MGRKRKNWSKIVEEHGVRVRVYERGNTDVLWASVVAGDNAKRLDGKPLKSNKKRQSLKTRDRKKAEQRAKALAKEIAEIQITGRQPDTLTLGELRRLYLHHAGPLLSDSRTRFMETTLGLFVEHFGAGFPMADFGEHSAKTYLDARRRGKLQPDDRRASDSPSDGTLRNELAALSTVCNWATGYKQDGRPLLSRNPVKGEIPQYTDQKRPRMSRDRYEKLLEVADGIDYQGGQFRLALILAWETGRRINAIMHLKASDLLFSRDRTRAVLAEAGLDEEWADKWSADAVIRWRAEWDKVGKMTVAPISPRARNAIEAYLRDHPIVGDAWLFPAAQKVDSPTPKATAYFWLKRAEKAAKLPHLSRGGWHAFRRAWATRRKNLPAADVAASGGWHDTKTLQSVYQGADPATMRDVVNLD